MDDRPPPMIIETFIDAQDLTNSQSLVFIDDNGRKWDVEEALNASPSSDGNSDGGRPEVILERWIIQLSGGPREVPPGLGVILPRVYKNTTVLFRSLFTCLRLFPAWRIGKRSFQSRSSPTTPRLRYRISQDPKLDSRARQDNLTVPLCDDRDDIIENHAFDPIDSPAGPLSIHVTYRTSCDFRIDDSEAFLSARFMDEPFFDRPQARRMESAPTKRNYLDEGVPQKQQTRPSLAEQGQAYGSMSTFHHIETGTSPISALKAAQFPSESPEDSHARTAMRSKDSKSSLPPADPPPQRRPSVSFTPFKAPSLSASPSHIEQARGSSLGKSSPLAVLAEARHPSGPVPPRGSPKTSDHGRVPSSSNSPKPPPPQRYSSSFSHRKAKPSTGSSKTEDDMSSGKGSASSAQPGSGVLAEGGASSGSLQTDDDNISEFLKMLDQKKDLKSFRTSPHNSPSDAATRRTSAALSKFQRMRDSNAALSESISSSQLMHRSSSSSSRQLASVPPMVAATSLSTSSSPGKPISPHTPHTPAIPSRLSAASVAEYHPPPSTQPHRAQPDPPRPHDRDRDRDTDTSAPTSEPIDIPTSPRPIRSSFRRSSSVAPNQQVPPPDADEEIFPFFMRSASLGLDDRPPPSRSALLGMQESPLQHHHHCGGGDSSAVANPSVENRPTFGPSLALSSGSGDHGGSSSRAGVSLARQRSSSGSQHHDTIGSGNGSVGASGSASGVPFPPRRGGASLPYRSHLSRGGGRGDTPPPQSSSSAHGHGGGSSSNSLMERGSLHSGGSDAGGGIGGLGGAQRSSIRTSGRYSFSSRPASTFEDEEPLLFAMSDFDAAAAAGGQGQGQGGRRSREDLRGGGGGGSGLAGRRGRGDSG